MTGAKRAAFRVIDAAGSPLRPLLSPRPSGAKPIRNILVLEPWFIGDLVLATPILRALREKYPDARITLLGKPHATELLEHSGLVDDVIVFDFPWTASGASRKYDPRRYDPAQWKSLAADLRKRRFDLTMDARMDIRSNVIAFMSGAPRRVGFGFGGGAFLLTDAVTAQPDAHHRVVDWMSLMPPLADSASESESAELLARRLPPLLKVTEQERDAAARTLAANGISENDTVVAIHGGAGDARRRWPIENFAEVAKTLVSRYRAKIVLLLEPGADDPRLDIADATLRTTLREMMAILDRCDLFLCNDSGPMHIADALDVPVVAIFLTGNPVWHRPFRDFQKVVGAGTGHDFREAPAVAAAIDAADEQLRFGISRRQQTRAGVRG
ncbi:MAG TPA: glycosyltransferase family 9 protein [Gemmatimonadaceae bacterium]|nr:glycosyltransferase family 9 protein [Gemmatimonadaceae bacterium]